MVSNETQVDIANTTVEHTEEEKASLREAHVLRSQWMKHRVPAAEDEKVQKDSSRDPHADEKLKAARKQSNHWAARKSPQGR